MRPIERVERHGDGEFDAEPADVVRAERVELLRMADLHDLLVGTPLVVMNEEVLDVSIAGGLADHTRGTCPKFSDLATTNP